MPLRCARCQQPLTTKTAEEVVEEQGTCASLVYVCLDNPDCEAPYVRRHDGTVE